MKDSPKSLDRTLDFELRGRGHHAIYRRPGLAVTIEPMSESNAELARRGYEAASRGDLEVIAGLLDDEVVWHGGDPSESGACRNSGEALEFMRRAIARGGIGELVDVVEAGEQVVVILRPAGPGADEETGLTANLTTFREGKAVEMVHYPNAADALAAIGL